MTIFTNRGKKINPKIHFELQKIPDNQSNPKQKEQYWNTGDITISGHTSKPP